MKGLDNYIPEPIHILPPHLSHEFLTGKTTDTQTPFVINTISGISSSQDKLNASSYLRAEYNLLVSFSSFPFIVHDVSFFCKQDNAPKNIILDNNQKLPELGIICMGYINLFKAVVSLPVSLELCIQYACNICDGLEEVHQRMLIHRNINPSSLMVHQSGQIHLCGFHLSHNYLTDTESVEYEFSSQKRSMAFEEIDTLIYISPEHTGRVKNKPDQRSDMYCLGVVLYEMLTGYPPFQFSDALEMMHAHIARPPPPLSSCFSSLSDIINILLAKDPERRYMTPIGLKGDLLTCQEMLAKTGIIKKFTLRKKDLLVYSRITGGIFCRQREINIINNSLSNIREKSSVVFITGPAGIGKTALVKVLLKDVNEHGIFGNGKFDELHAPRKFPGPVASAIRHLLVQSLAVADLSKWRKQLLKIISGCERLFVDMFPQMEPYVGVVPSVENLPASERKNRMHAMLSDLMVMMSTLSPIVLFFDDLQWADKSSLELIEVIATSSDTNIVVIACCREFTPDLNETVALLKNKRRDLCISLPLEPFTLDNVLELVGDSLQVEERDKLKSLATLIYEKTSGNPLFVIQFLSQLYKRSLVFYDWESQQWQWDSPSIKELGYSGLVSFFLDLFHDLSAETQNMLSFAALIGHKFKLSILEHFANKFGFPSVNMAVIEATKGGFLTYMGKNEYSFTHDKVYHSAYLLSSETMREEIYYALGIYLMKSDDGDTCIAALQYMKHATRKLLERAKESEEVQNIIHKAFEVALKTGVTAKSASAYHRALEYLTIGKNLGATNWDTDPEMAFNYGIDLAECLYLTGSYEESSESFAHLLQKPLSLSQKVTVYQIETQVLASAVNYTKAIEIGLECLDFMGFHIKELNENLELSHHLLQNTDLNTVLIAPMADAKICMLMEILTNLVINAFFTDKELHLRLGSEILQLTLTHGPTPSCGVGMGLFALSYATDYNNPMKAYEIAKLGLDLYERFPLNCVKCRVFFLFSILNHWKMPVSDSLQYLYASLNASQACGNYLYTGYAVSHISNTMLWAGRNIQETLAELRVLSKQILKAELSDMQLVFGVSLGYASLLAGITMGEDSYTTIDGSVVESRYLRDQKNYSIVEIWYTGSKVESLYMFGFYAEAIEQGSYFVTILGALKGHLNEPRGLAYYVLAILATIPTPKEEEPISKEISEKADAAIVEINRVYPHLRIWIENCSHNFAHYDFLIQAEIARVRGAMFFYNKAIQHAKTYYYCYIRALAHELAVRCTSDLGLDFVAEMALAKAIKGYKQWGAIQKVKQLTHKYSRYSSLLKNSIEIPPQSSTPSEEATSTKFDMRTIIKANHVLSQELTLPQVLQKFTSIVLENVGAEQAAIILVDKNSSNSWRVASSWNVQDDNRENAPSYQPSEYSNNTSSLSSSSVPMVGARKHLVNFVMHKKTPLAIECFEKSEFYDPLQALLIGSVLCVPIELKGNLCGVVYLEHSAPRVLQADRLDLMSLLCNQLYISIENANLYDSIQTSEHRYKTLAEGLPIMAFLQESKGNTFANSKLLQFFGLPTCNCESLSLEQVITRIHKDDLRNFMAAWNHAAENARSAEVEMRMKRAIDGIYRWTLCHVSVSFDSHNHAEMLLATWMDIQDLKNAQAEQIKKVEIEASELKYRSLAEAIPQIVWTSTPDGDVNYFNTRWYEFTGLTEEQSLGSNYTGAFHPDDLASWPSLKSKSHFSEKKLRIRRKDGEYRWHLARAIYLPTSGGKRFGSFIDIEDQVKTEISLTQAREAADKAAHNQAFFVANMSHEIRTPMNGLLGMLHLLMETDLNEEQSDCADTMKRSADSLLRIIDDVLDFSKIQEGKLELRSDELNVELILEDVTETLSILASTAELMFYVHPDIPAKLIGDSGKLRQILMNLIGNAVKFTPTGEIYTSCTVEKRTKADIMLKFQVADTGEGISKEKQTQLFTPFYQADATLNRAHGGTGLGLAISKQLVTLFHGEIGVESTLGKGSTFTFTALFKIAPKQPIPEPPFFSPSYSCVVISNLPQSLQILENHLRACKLCFTSVTSEEEAKTVLEEAIVSTKRKIKCVIVDLFSHQAADTNIQPIISLIGEKQVILLVNSLQRPNLVKIYPTATFLLKPVTFPKLVLALHGRCESPLRKSTDKDFIYSSESRVLIVEDNKINQKVIAKFLQKEHVMFSIANNGLEAYEMVKDKPFGYFSVILLDLAMPVWDGYKACEELRKLEKERGSYRHPIVALTANVQGGIVEDCVGRGMDCVLSKPVDFASLSSILQTYCPKL